MNKDDQMMFGDPTFLAAKRRLLASSSVTVRSCQSSRACVFRTSKHKAGDPHHHRCVRWPLYYSNIHGDFFSISSSRSSDGNSSLLDEGGSTSQVPQTTVELAGYGSVVWPDSLSEWLVEGEGLQ